MAGTHKRRHEEESSLPAQKRARHQPHTDSPTWSLPIRSIPASVEHSASAPSPSEGIPKDAKPRSRLEEPNKNSDSESEFSGFGDVDPDSDAASTTSTRAQCGRKTITKPETGGEKRRCQLREVMRKFWQRDLASAFDRDLLPSTVVIQKRLAGALTRLIPYETPTAINEVLRAEIGAEGKECIDRWVVDKVRRDLVSQGREPMEPRDDPWARLLG